MQPSAVLKIPSNTDFRLCCSDSPEMLPHLCRILQNCAGGSDMHRSTFMKSPGNNGFRLCCSDSSEMLPHAYSPEMLSHPCRILQKRVVAASGDSDMHPSTFLKSPRSYAHHFGFGMDPLSKDYKVTCIEIWVMEKFGFWTRKLVVESTLIVKRPIGYGVNGEIFVETTSSNLVMIDPRTQEIVKCIGPLENGYSLQVLVYKKSLVSIKKLSTCNLIRGLEFEQQRVSDNV
ncbi:putative F-box/kelch-repeat protein-like [Capsicum annuum]|nr:putative F-box/kelch-repeat protein-like [Capsicum annuum]